MQALVIEDDKNLARLLAKWLAGCGYEVRVCSTLSEAEAYIFAVPDLRIITLDLNLTDSTHETTIPRIRDIRDQNPQALLVVISGVIGHSEESTITRLGADAMIEKHEIVTEKSFLGKLWDVLSSVFRNPTAYQTRGIVLEGISKKVAKRCNDLKVSIGESLTNEPPKE
jgi:CheY-like chemotaxis protein